MGKVIAVEYVTLDGVFEEPAAGPNVWTTKTGVSVATYVPA
jgi:hypothetical protein